MKRFLLIVCLTLTQFFVYAQDQNAVPNQLVLKLHEAVGDHQRVLALQGIADYFIWNEDFDNAKPYVDEIAQLAESSNDNYTKALYCFYTLSYLLGDRQFLQAIPYLNEMEPLLDGLGDDDDCNRLRLNAYNVLAKYYWSYDMLPETYEYLNKCIQINEKRGYSHADFNLNRKQMLLYLAMHRYRECIAIGKKMACIQAGSLEKTWYHLEMLDAYALCGVIDTAFCYADSAALSDTSGKLGWLINERKANLYKDVGDYKGAYEFAERMRHDESVNSVMRGDSLYVVYRSNLYKALYYNQEHRFDSALQCINRSVETGALVSLSDELDALSIRTDILCNTGLYQEATENMKTTQLLADSLAKVQNVQNVEAMMFQQQMKEYEAEQEYLSFQRESRQRMRFLVLAIVALLLLLGLVVLLLVTNKRRLKAKMTEEELEVRNRELTEAAVVMMKKNESYTDVIGQLKEIKESTFDRDTRKAIDRVSKKIEQTMDDDYYEEFSVRFKQVHPEFIAKLTKRHPDLTPNEIKICSFLRLNMSSKEISALTGQSSTAIDMTRFRIRRKLGFAHDDHGRLSNYLMQL